MDFEKLGAFYLGKEFDVESDRLLDRLLMYDARDLTTHAVCVGMTGSGKTGLCIDLLEEAAIDRVPAIIIDPKGDITNLLLQFPELRPEDFRPWINSDDARRKALSLDQYALNQAELWRNGLAEWGQDSSRIKMLRDSAEYNIFTPGSEAGVSVSVLQSFRSPEKAFTENSELLRERIQGTVSALLGLLGIDADPVRSREHILLATLFEHHWRRGQDLDVGKLILSVQNPPVSQLGVFDVDTFFPPKDRFELAMSLNAIVASPSFATWRSGVPLEIGSFLAAPDGKPRHSIFYLAHLNDTERTFFVTMLLNELIGWMRAQPGTTSLRALLYMDEIFGFFPPVSNPPSKKPMLTLLKQARAYGLGVILSTQNPVDLDYKGLTNAGTWFIGRLQTERDKARVLDGLETASSQSGRGLIRKELDELISKLGKRVFLLHNIHEDGPVTFQTRWAMSYLRGPLTRSQIEKLKADWGEIEGESTPPSQTEPKASGPGAEHRLKSLTSGRYSSNPPTLPPNMKQVFLRVEKDARSVNLELPLDQEISSASPERSLVYKPGIVSSGRVHFVDRKKNVEECEEYALLANVPRGLGALRWDEAKVLGANVRFQDQPETEASFEQLPDAIDESKEMTRLKSELDDHLYRSRSLKLLYSPALKVYSEHGESERDFKMRLTQLAREKRDDEVDDLNASYEKKIRTVEERLKKAELALDKKESTSDARGRELLVSVGESVLGMFLGRRSVRSASSALGKYRMRSTAKIAVKEAEEKIESLKREVEALEEELKGRTDAIAERWDQALGEFQEIAITPRRADVEIDFLAVAWEPFWLVHTENSRGLPKEQLFKAY